MEVRLQREQEKRIPIKITGQSKMQPAKRSEKRIP
jgi:hypothetical protein